MVCSEALGPYYPSQGRFADVVFTAVVDVDLDLAQSRIEDMKAGEHGSKWAAAKAFKTCEEMLASDVRNLQLLVWDHKLKALPCLMPSMYNPVRPVYEEHSYASM